MTDRRYINLWTVLAATVILSLGFSLLIGWFIWTGLAGVSATHHHCPHCEIAYSRGLFHGIDYAERGVARLDTADGRRYIVWTGDAFGKDDK